MIDFSKKIIFYFDKDVVSIDLLKNIISPFYTYRGFTSRNELLNTIKNGVIPHILLLHIDSDTPSTSRLVETIRTVCKEISIISVISHRTDTIYRDLFEINFYDHIFKPFDKDSILKKLNRVIREYKFINMADSEHYLIHTFANLEELRDKNTLGHNSRVGLISYEIAKYLKCNSVCQKIIKYAAMLHDIGKHGIPEIILNKPGKLTNDEFDTIRSHPTLGYQILSPILNTNIESLNMASEVTLKHHEKLDGSGYPNNLEENDIPLYVRIVTIVDMFDAISSKRSYHNKSNFSDTMDILNHEVKDHKLDPIVFNVLYKLKETVQTIASKYSTPNMLTSIQSTNDNQIEQCLYCYKRNIQK